MGSEVLIVDDEPTVRLVVRNLLERSGLTVWEAASGAEAVRECETHGEQIGVVVSDFSMPGMDGLETLAALRELNPDVRGFLFTGEANVSGTAGTRVFRKPHEVAELVVAVMTAVESG